MWLTCPSGTTILTLTVRCSLWCMHRCDKHMARPNGSLLGSQRVIHYTRLRDLTIRGKMTVARRERRHDLQIINKLQIVTSTLVDIHFRKNPCLNRRAAPLCIHISFNHATVQSEISKTSDSTISFLIIKQKIQVNIRLQTTVKDCRLSCVESKSRVFSLTIIWKLKIFFHVKQILNSIL